MSKGERRGKRCLLGRNSPCLGIISRLRSGWEAWFFRTSRRQNPQLHPGLCFLSVLVCGGYDFILFINLPKSMYRKHTMHQAVHPDSEEETVKRQGQQSPFLSNQGVKSTACRKWGQVETLSNGGTGWHCLSQCSSLKQVSLLCFLWILFQWSINTGELSLFYYTINEKKERTQ